MTRPWHLHQRGFTLIELLIVVAIITILVGSTMTLVTAPMTETAKATSTQIRLHGESSLMEALASDAHRSDRVESDPSRPGESLRWLRDNQPVATYELTSNGHIRRTQDPGRHQVLDLGWPVTEIQAQGTTESALAGRLVQITILRRVRPDHQAAAPAIAQSSGTLALTLALRPAIWGPSPGTPTVAQP